MPPGHRTAQSQAGAARTGLSNGTDGNSRQPGVIAVYGRPGLDARRRAHTAPAPVRPPCAQVYRVRQDELAAETGPAPSSVPGTTRDAA